MNESFNQSVIHLFRHAMPRSVQESDCFSELQIFKTLLKTFMRTYIGERCCHWLLSLSLFLLTCDLFSPQRQGRSDTFATEFDLEAEEYVPLPKGDVHKKKEIVQDVTLHDLDIANAKPQVGYILCFSVCIPTYCHLGNVLHIIHWLRAT